MTIIALFAALTEASAAVSLPFLDDGDRDIYVWFLISFPFSLVVFFFMTLNFNYKALYSPADFAKGKHFLQLINEAVRQKGARLSPPSPEPIEQDNDSATLEKDLNPCQPQSFTMRHASSDNAQAPPAFINLLAKPGMQQSFQLHHILHGLHIIDTRRIETRKGFELLVSEVAQAFNNPPDANDLIIFLANQKSLKLINQSTLDKLNSAKSNRSYMIYNLGTLTLTLTSAS
ncbi:hypothetical protein [Pseudomonas fluorescens]|nr:hypothetical protein [Pseudomonas fluorescens]